MREQPYDTIETDKLRIEIYPDEYPDNPREAWDNFGTMVCFHHRYNLGDNNHGYNNPDDFIEFMQHNTVVALPLYLYDHSGLSMSTSCDSYPFCDQWDSMQVGWIYVTKYDVLNGYDWKYLTSKRVEKITGYLKSEVEVYNYYLMGYVFGFKTYCKVCNGELDSCWGFYGDNWQENGLLEYAQDSHCTVCANNWIRLAEIGE